PDSSLPLPWGGVDEAEDVGLEPTREYQGRQQSPEHERTAKLDKSLAHSLPSWTSGDQPTGLLLHDGVGEKWWGVVVAPASQSLGVVSPVPGRSPACRHYLRTIFSLRASVTELPGNYRPVAVNL